MGLGRNVKERTRREFPNPTVIERGSGSPLQDQAKMFDVATVCAHSGTYIHGPTPARFVRGATDRHAPDRDELEAPASEPTHLVGRLETLENDIDCRSRRSHIVLPNGARLSSAALMKNSLPSRAASASAAG